MSDLEITPNPASRAHLDPDVAAPEAEPAQESRPSDDQAGGSPATESLESTEASAPQGEITQEGDIVKLPDGREISLAQVQEWASASSEADEKGPLSRRIEELERRLAASAPSAQSASQQDFISPLEEANQWLDARRDQYYKAGLTPTPDQIRLDLAQAQVAELNRQMQESMSSWKTEREAQVKAQEEANQARSVEALSVKYPNVKHELGARVLKAFLAEASSAGQKDLEKVVKEVHEIIPRLVMQVYGEPKRAQLRSLAGNAPRGGAIKAPSPKDYGSDLGSLDRMAEDLAAMRKSGG